MDLLELLQEAVPEPEVPEGADAAAILKHRIETLGFNKAWRFSIQTKMEDEILEACLNRKPKPKLSIPDRAEVDASGIPNSGQMLLRWEAVRAAGRTHAEDQFDSIYAKYEAIVRAKADEHEALRQELLKCQ